MQIHHPEASFRKDGEYAVTMNPGSDAPFAVIELSEDGNTFLFAPEADVDRLLSAAARAKAMFEALRRPHAYVRAIGGCAECGIDPGHHPKVVPGAVMGEHPYPESPLCESWIPLSSGRPIKCTQDGGHEGPHSAFSNTWRWTGTGPDARRVAEPLVISDATIAQARYFEEHPWDEDEAEAAR